MGSMNRGGMKPSDVSSLQNVRGSTPPVVRAGCSNVMLTRDMFLFWQCLGYVLWEC